MLKRAGLPKIRLHDSRHTTLSLMEKAGVPISIISKWAGHYDSSFMMKTYVHASDDDLQQGPQALAKIHVVIGKHILISCFSRSLIPARPPASTWMCQGCCTQLLYLVLAGRSRASGLLAVIALRGQATASIAATHAGHFGTSQPRGDQEGGLRCNLQRRRDWALTANWSKR
jgi:hypothetical protein